jgi:hypothetical protein
VRQRKAAAPCARGKDDPQAAGCIHVGTAVARRAHPAGLDDLGDAALDNIHRDGEAHLFVKEGAARRRLVWKGRRIEPAKKSEHTRSARGAPGAAAVARWRCTHATGRRKRAPVAPGAGPGTAHPTVGAAGGVDGGVDSDEAAAAVQQRAAAVAWRQVGAAGMGGAAKGLAASGGAARRDAAQRAAAAERRRFGVQQRRARAAAAHLG